MSKKNGLVLFYISICCFFLMSVSFLLMPLDLVAKEMETFNFLIGVMFWVFFVAGIITQYILSRIRKNWFIRNKIRRYQFNRRIGLFAFFKNLYGSIADGMFVASLIGLIIAMFVTDGVGYACYVFMSLLVFSFCAHCIFNGNIYYFLTNQEEILKAVEAKKSEKSEKERL